MRRFLCFSLCLGLMVSACKKKFTQEDLDKARAECKASGGGSGSGSGDGTTTVTKKDKAAVIAACLPSINTMLRGLYTAPQPYFILRQSTVYATTADAPALMLVTSEGTPLVFGANTATGLGSTAAAVTTNLEAMAKDADVQAQFVDREGDNKGKGYRVHISTGSTRAAYNASAGGEALVEMEAPVTQKIYNRAASIRPNNGVIAAITLPAGENDAARFAAVNGANGRMGWHDCAVDKDDNVTLQYTIALLTAAPA